MNVFDSANCIWHAPNEPDAANPAMKLWLTVGDQRRRVADLGR